MKPMFRHERRALPEPVMLAKTCSACNACNPCRSAKVAAKKFMCPGGVEVGYDASFVAEGKRLWEDTSLSSNGLACNTWHQNFGHSTRPSSKPIHTKWRWLRNEPAWVKSPRTKWFSSVCWYRCSKTRCPGVRVA